MNKDKAFKYIEHSAYFQASKHLDALLDVLEYNMTDDELAELDESSFDEYMRDIERDCELQDELDARESF